MHKLKDTTRWLGTEQQTREAGSRLARALLPLAQTASEQMRSTRARSGALVVFVRGDLGAGKSTFVRGFLTEAGVRGVMPSPTYSLVEPYQVDGLTLYHMDAYRLADSAELDYLGLDELHQPGCLALIEWPDHIRDALPDPIITVNLSMSVRTRSGASKGGDAKAGDAVIDQPVHHVTGRAVTFQFEPRCQHELECLEPVSSWSKLRQVPT